MQKQGQTAERQNVSQSIRNGLFGALYVISKQHISSKTSSFVELLVKLAQLLSFVLAEDAGFVWVKNSMSGLKLVVGLTTVNGYAEWFDGSAFLVLFYLSLAWVSVFVSLFLWATWSFARGSFSALWPLRLLRAVGSTSATLLYIPMLTLLLAGFRCTREAVLYQGGQDGSSWWEQTGFTCNSPGWAVQVAITAVFLTTFISLCSIWAACVQDRHLLSTNLSAKAHGRMDFFFVCAKTLLVCMIKGWPQQIPPYAHIGVLIAVSCVWLAFAVFTQPFLHHVMNKAHAAAACVLLSACICLAVGQSYAKIDAAVAWYMALPFAALAGAGLVDARANYIATCPTASLASAGDVELRVRFMIHEALYGHAVSVLPIEQRVLVTQAQTAGSGSGPAGVGVGLPHPQKVAVEEEGGMLYKGEKGSSLVGAAEDDVAADLMALSQEDDVEARSILVRRIFGRASEACAAGARGLDPGHAVSSLYVEGLARFRYSPLLHVAASAFHSVCSGNRHLQMSHLLQAERRSPGLDLQYFIFATRRSVEEKSGGAGGKQGTSALARVAFEKYTGDAKAAVAACLTSQSSFWSELSSPRPSLPKLHVLAERMSHAIHSANKCFAELTKLNAHSLSVIRLQAEFTLYALNDPDRAALLVAEAERVAEAQNKELRAAQGKRLRVLEQSSLDVMSESAGLIIISGAPGNLGTILTASPAACRMFGYPRWQLEKRPIDIIVPSPIAEWHTQALRRFIVTGSSRVVDNTRMVVGQHKSGFVFPLMLTVREAAAAASDGPPTLIGLMQPMASDDDFLLMDANMAICAASQRSMSTFSLSISGLTSRETNMKSLVPDIAAHMAALESEAGALVQMHLPSPEGGSTGEDGDGDEGTEAFVGGEGGARASARRGGRRRSILAGHAQDTMAQMQGATKAKLQTQGNKTWIKAWITRHTSQTGHFFYSMVWAPAKAPVTGGVVTDASPTSPAAHVVGRSSDNPAALDSRSTEDHSLDAMKRPAMLANMGCPYLSGSSVTRASPPPPHTGHPAPRPAPTASHAAVMDVTGRSQSREDGLPASHDLHTSHGHVIRKGFSESLMVDRTGGTIEEDEHEPELRLGAPIQRNMSKESLRVQPPFFPPRLMPEPGAHVDFPNSARGGRRDESARTPASPAHAAAHASTSEVHVAVDSSRMGAHRRGSRESAGLRGAGGLEEQSPPVSALGSTSVAARLGVLRANAMAALSPLATGRSRGHSQSTWSHPASHPASPSNSNTPRGTSSASVPRPSSANPGVAPTPSGRALALAHPPSSLPGAGATVDVRDVGVVAAKASGAGMSMSRNISFQQPSSSSARPPAVLTTAVPARTALRVHMSDEVHSVEDREGGKGSSGSEEEESDEEEEEAQVVKGQRVSDRGAVQASGRKLGLDMGDGAAGGGGGDRGSYASSRMSTHNKRMLSKLRHVVDGSAQQPLIPQLGLLRLVALSVSAAAACVAIGLNVYASANLSSILNGARSTFLVGNLVDRVQTGTQRLSTVVYGNMGLMLSHPLLNSSQLLQQQRELAVDVIQTAVLESKALFSAALQAPPEFARMFLGPSVNFTRVVINGLTGAPQTQSLQLSIHEAVSAYLLACLRLASMDAGDITVTHPDFLMLANNGFPGLDFSDKLNATNSNAVTYLTQQTKGLNSFMTVVFTATLCVLGAACLTIMLPAVLSLDAARDKMLLSFIVLPPIILNTLRSQSEQYLAAFQAEDDMDEDEEDEGGSQGSGDSLEIDEENPLGKAKEDETGALLPTDAEGEFNWTLVTAHARSLAKSSQTTGAEEGCRKGKATDSSSSSSSCAALPRWAPCCTRLTCCGVPGGPAALARRLSSRAMSMATSPSAAMKRREKGRKAKVNPTWSEQAPGRAARKSPLGAMKLLLLFNSPLVFLFILLALSMTQTESNLRQGLRSTHLAVASQYRQADVRAGYLSIRRAMRRFSPPALVGDDLTHVRDAVQSLRYWSHVLLGKPPRPVSDTDSLDASDTASRVQGLLHGQGISGTSDSDAAVINAMTAGPGLCAVIFNHADSGVRSIFREQADCESWPAGSASSLAGLARVEDDWARAVLQLADRRAAATSLNATAGTVEMAAGDVRPYIPAAEFAGPTMQMVYMATAGILSPAYSYQTAVLQKATLASFESFAAFQTALLSSCLVLYVALLTVVYVILVPRINAGMLKQRALLLLLPLQVFDHPTATGLREAMNHALASSGISMSLKGVRGGASSQGSVAQRQ